MVFLIFLVIVAVVVHRAMTPEQRANAARSLLEHLRVAKTVAMRTRPECEAFHEALRGRTSRALVTPAIIGLNVAVFMAMLVSPGAIASPDTLVRWGGNFGPRTTNGEWWRLVASTFVHSGLWNLMVEMLALVQAGIIVERALGYFSLAAVYLAAAALTSLVSLALHPVGVSVGASGPVFAVYGLLIASFASGTLRRGPLAIPLRAGTRLIPAAALFVLYSMMSDEVTGAAALAGLALGLACGAGLAIGVLDRKPPLYRIAAATALTAGLAVASAVPLRGLADVRPEIERVAALEDRTSRAYQDALERFRKDRVGADALVQLIDKTILPELRAERTRLKAIDGVPREHQPLVASADEYLRLRDESWRLRADGLRKTNMLKLRQAENAERAALEALHRIGTLSPN